MMTTGGTHARGGQYPSTRGVPIPYAPKGIQDVIESDSDSDLAPGPGEYYKASQSAFNQHAQPERLQFFGSTVERFVDPAIKTKGVSTEIGPGYYEQKPGVAKNGFGVSGTKVSRAGQHVGFNTGCGRFNGVKSTKSINKPDLTPGPGTY